MAKENPVMRVVGGEVFESNKPSSMKKGHIHVGPNPGITREAMLFTVAP